MDFELNDEQRQLSDSLERLLAQQYGFEQRQAIIRSQSGFSPAVWSRIAELGILSLPVSEHAGGFGGGAVDLMRPMTLIGQALVVEPVLTHLAATRLLDRATGSAGAVADLLQQAMAGEQRLAWARGVPGGAGACTATATGDGWVLNGRLTGIFGADVAGHLLVAVPAGIQAALFLVA
nr:acyl-CoA dehydrogenase family protein [Lautropia sp.]